METLPNWQSGFILATRALVFSDKCGTLKISHFPGFSNLIGFDHLEEEKCVWCSAGARQLQPCWWWGWAGSGWRPRSCAAFVPFQLAQGSRRKGLWLWFVVMVWHAGPLGTSVTSVLLAVITRGIKLSLCHRRSWCRTLVLCQELPVAPFSSQPSLKSIFYCSFRKDGQLKVQKGSSVVFDSTF